MARPTIFTEALGDQVCQKMLEGDSLRKIAEAEDMPDKASILLWVAKGARGDERYTKFYDQYCVIREAQAELFMDEIVDIADDSANDYGFKEGDDRDGHGAKPVFLSENVQRARLRCDMRLKAAEKFASKKYGNKQDTSVVVNVNQPLPEEDKDIVREYAKQETE